MRESVTVNVGTNTKITTKTPIRDYSINPSTQKDGQTDGNDSGVVILDPTEKLSEQTILAIEAKLINGMPYDFATKKKEMKSAIQVLAGWNDCAQKQEYSDFEKSLYVLAVECLIEMATEKKICIYGESKVSCKNVIDQINKCCKSAKGEIQPLGLFLDMTIERYERANIEKDIRNPKSYMKALLWSNFSTYQVDWEGFFERSYYGNL